MKRQNTILRPDTDDSKPTPILQEVKSSLSIISAAVSNTEQTVEIRQELDVLSTLIKEEEWHNIPAPVRTSIQGIIQFNENVTPKLLANIQRAHVRVETFDDRLRIMDRNLKGQVEIISLKIDRELKRVQESLVRSNQESLKSQALVEACTLKVSTQSDQVDQKMETFIARLQKIDDSIAELNETTVDLAKDAMNQANEFSKIQNVKNLIGPDKQTCPYRDLATFVKDMHEFKEDCMEQTVKLMSSKLLMNQKQNDKLFEEVRSDMIDFLRIQEQEIRNLGTKVNQLDEEMEGLLNDENDGNSRESRASRLERHRRMSKSPISQRDYSRLSRKSHQSKNEDEEIDYKKNRRHYNKAQTLGEDINLKLGQSPTKRHQAKDTQQQQKNIDGVTSSPGEQSFAVLKEGKTQVFIDEYSQAGSPPQSNQGEEVEVVSPLLSEDKTGLKVGHALHDRKIDTTQNKSVGDIAEASFFKETLGVSVSNSNGPLNGTQDGIQFGQHEGTVHVADPKSSQKILVKGKPHGDSLFKPDETRSSRKSGTKPASLTNRIKSFIKNEQKNLDTNVLIKKENDYHGREKNKNRQLKPKHANRPSSRASRQSRHESRQGSRNDKEKELKKSTDETERTRIDELIHHQIEFEEKIGKQVVALRNMITVFSKAVWWIHQKQSAGQDDSLLNILDKQQKTELSSPTMTKTEIDQQTTQVPVNSLESSLNEVQETEQNTKKGKNVTALKSMRKSSDQRSSKTNQKVQKKRSFQFKPREEPSRAISPTMVKEAPPQAEDSLKSTSSKKEHSEEEDIEKLYPVTLAEKYHFIKVYVDKFKEKDTIAALYEKPKRKSTLHQLLSVKQGDLLWEQLAKAREAKQILFEQQEQAEKEKAIQAAIEVEPPNPSVLQHSQIKESENKMNATFNSLNSSRHSGGKQSFRQPSPQVPRIGDVCPKCAERPCLEQVDSLRKQLIIYIDELFRKKMKEFIEFIEEYIDVDEQIDPNQDNIIHTFYREHNTLHKMHENFRLLEYKRKKYIQAKKQVKSKSPTTRNESGLSPPQKNFLNSIYNQEPNLERKEMRATLRKFSLPEARLEANNTHPPDTNNTMYQSDYNEHQGAMRRGSARQISQPTIPNSRQSQKPLTLKQQMPPQIEITSSASTRRKASVFMENQQQLPIISTRKAHLTIDQRVWDANQIDSMVTIAQPKEFKIAEKLKYALFNNNSDSGVMQNHNTQGGMTPREFNFNFEINPSAIRRTIINQDSSYNNLSPVVSSQRGIHATKGGQTASNHVNVQFQELKLN